jgi:hypothetical protein
MSDCRCNENQLFRIPWLAVSCARADFASSSELEIVDKKDFSTSRKSQPFPSFGVRALQVYGRQHERVRLVDSVQLSASSLHVFPTPAMPCKIIHGKKFCEPKRS